MFLFICHRYRWTAISSRWLTSRCFLILIHSDEKSTWNVHCHSLSQMLASCQVLPEMFVFVIQIQVHHWLSSTLGSRAFYHVIRFAGPKEVTACGGRGGRHRWRPTKSASEVGYGNGFDRSGRPQGANSTHRSARKSHPAEVPYLRGVFRVGISSALSWFYPD